MATLAVTLKFAETLETTEDARPSGIAARMYRGPTMGLTAGETASRIVSGSGAAKVSATLAKVPSGPSGPPEPAAAGPSMSDTKACVKSPLGKVSSNSSSSSSRGGEASMVSRVKALTPAARESSIVVPPKSRTTRESVRSSTPASNAGLDTHVVGPVTLKTMGLPVDLTRRPDVQGTSWNLWKGPPVILRYTRRALGGQTHGQTDAREARTSAGPPRKKVWRAPE